MTRHRYEIAAADRHWIKRIGWQSVDDVLACSSDDVAAAGRTLDVLQIPLDAALGGPQRVFVKRFRYDDFGQRVKQMFRGTLFGKSPARREFEFLTEMRRREIPTVRPIAYGEQRRRAFLRAGFLITEGSEGFQSLDCFALDMLRRGPLKPSQRRALSQGLAVTIRKMHDAGVCHGGLFWRNILVRARPDGRYEFALLDPDAHARLHASPVPWAEAVADLSEVVASAIALGQRGGLARFMKAYFQVSNLRGPQRQETLQLVGRAQRHVRSEQQRMAITQALGWLRRRTAGEHDGQPDGPAITSIDGFFSLLSSGSPASRPAPDGCKSIRFSFSDLGGIPGALDRTVIISGAHVSVTATAPARPDLIIRTDPVTWLTIIAGRTDAYAHLRSGRLRMDGDMLLLPVLMEHLERREAVGSTAPTEPTPDRPSHTMTKEDSAVTTSPSSPRSPAVVRSFGHKYKADQYAKYYAEKHHATLGRRLSNHLEAQMIRRALRRIGRAHRFERVLDCPSGTGRLLPTLASLKLSVIAMDTSGAMLQEGRRYHGLFSEPPTELVGSALDIALSDNAVDVVLCSRLLHHIGDHADRLKILREFTRVARVGVVVSFFDAHSYRAWKRQRKIRRTGKPSGRLAMSRAACVAEAEAAGLKPLGMNALLRFHTEVTAAAFLC